MLERVKINEIPKTSCWNMNSVWEIESKRIEHFIEDEANDAFGRDPDNPDRVKAFAPSVWNKISVQFPYDPEIDPKVLADARAGRLQARAGSRIAIAALFWLGRVAFGLELAVFVAMWYFGESSPVIIVHGGLLALSAWILGWGLGNFFVGLSPDSEGMRQHPARVYAAMFGGVIGVGVITAIRVHYQADGGFAVVAITLILALVIALFEALYISMEFHYTARHNDMYRAQVLFANAQHNRIYEEEGKGWKEQFVARIEFLTKTVRPMLKEAQAAAPERNGKAAAPQSKEEAE